MYDKYWLQNWLTENQNIWQNQPNMRNDTDRPDREMDSLDWKHGH